MKYKFVAYFLVAVMALITVTGTSIDRVFAGEPVSYEGFAELSSQLPDATFMVFEGSCIFAAVHSINTIMNPAWNAEIRVIEDDITLPVGVVINNRNVTIRTATGTTRVISSDVATSPIITVTNGGSLNLEAGIILEHSNANDSVDTVLINSGSTLDMRSGSANSTQLQDGCLGER